MARNGSTKNKILSMIAKKDRTLSDICVELSLAPSTVSQHLQELKDIGAVEWVQNDHVKKWKYYKLNPDFDYKKLGVGELPRENSRNMPNRIFFYSMGIAALAVVAYLAVSTFMGNVQSSSMVQVRLTDPPIVPSGTQGLYINYSSVSIHAVGNGNSEWIQSNASGTVNLLSLVNFSQMIAGVEVTHNSKIDGVRFNISSSYILINGTAYNVSVPSGEINTHILENRYVNASSEVLVDFSPTVVAMYVNGSSEFVMLPSVRAVVANAQETKSGKMGAARRGEKTRLSNDEIEMLYNSESYLSITGASLTSEQNGSTEVSISVKNSGNSSVDLSNIVILGNQTPVTTLNFTCNGSTDSVNSMVSQWCSRLEEIGLKAGSNGTSVRSSFDTLQRIAYCRGVEFIIERNGTLDLVGSGKLGAGNEGYPYTPFNYTLAPGGSATFSFGGQLALRGNLEISLVDGAHYRIAVLGESGAHALENVTAG
jgi:DNA-binding transcriptional ArsR family regulator